MSRTLYEADTAFSYYSKFSTATRDLLQIHGYEPATNRRQFNAMSGDYRSISDSASTDPTDISDILLSTRAHLADLAIREGIRLVAAMLSIDLTRSGLMRYAIKTYKTIPVVMEMESVAPRVMSLARKPLSKFTAANIISEHDAGNTNDFRRG